MSALHSSSFVSEDGRHFRLKVSYDEDPESPREFDNV